MNSDSLLPIENIVNKIYLIRQKKVMVDSDLALLYGVSTSRLNEQVKRNKKRFPEDFMFHLEKEEYDILKSQNAISSDWGGRRKLPFVFTEQGVAMLSSVLHSDRAIFVNIQIMRAFTQLRHYLSTHDDLKIKIEAMEKKYDEQFQFVFEAIKKLIDVKSKPKRKIGYKINSSNQ